MSFRHVEYWPPEAYLQQVELIGDGQMAETHLALLKPPSGPVCRGYVKHFTSLNTTRGLFNEWFAYHVMSALAIPQPQAALMAAPRWGSRELVPAFVSCEPSPHHSGTPKQVYDIRVVEHCRQLASRLLGCIDLPRLLAADQLLANDDRNMGNLVFTGKDTFVAIDHSNVLHGPNWTSSELWFTQHPCMMKPLLVFEAAIGMLPGRFASAVVAAADAVEEAYYLCQDDLRTVLGAGKSADVALAMDVTWWRCIELGRWMRAQLGVI